MKALVPFSERKKGITVKGVDWYWIPVLHQLVIVDVTIEYNFNVQFCLIPFWPVSLSIQISNYPFAQRHYSQSAKGIEKYSIAKLRLDVSTFIDFKLWFTVLNDRYRKSVWRCQGTMNAALCIDIFPFESINFKCTRNTMRMNHICFSLNAFIVNISRS